MVCEFCHAILFFYAIFWRDPNILSRQFAAIKIHHLGIISIAKPVTDLLAEHFRHARRDRHGRADIAREIMDEF